MFGDDAQALSVDVGDGAKKLAKDESSFDEIFLKCTRWYIEKHM